VCSLQDRINNYLTNRNVGTAPTGRRELQLVSTADNIAGIPTNPGGFLSARRIFCAANQDLRFFESGCRGERAEQRAPYTRKLTLDRAGQDLARW